MLSLKTRKAVIYAKKVRACRIQKALRYVDEIINIAKIEENCTCAPLELLSREVCLSELKISPCEMKNYGGTRHLAVSRIQNAVKYDIFQEKICLYNASYLERCACAFYIKPRFSAIYMSPLNWGIRVTNMHFYTCDRRMNAVYAFWDSIRDLVHQVQANRDIIKPPPRRPRRRIWLLEDLVRPLINGRAFTYFVTFKGGNFTHGEEYNFEFEFHATTIAINKI